MGILSRLKDPFARRENERLGAELAEARAELDYVYLAAGIDPLEEDEEEAKTDGEAL